jgi:hypothetical protein
MTHIGGFWQLLNNMKLQEQISRIKSVMGIITEETNGATEADFINLLKEKGFKQYTNQSELDKDFGKGKINLSFLLYCFGDAKEQIYCFKSKKDNKWFIGRQTLPIRNKQYFEGNDIEKGATFDKSFSYYVFKFPLDDNDSSQYTKAVNHYVNKGDGFVSKTEYDKVDDEYIRDYIGNISDVPNYDEIANRGTAKDTYLRLINNTIKSSKDYINTVSQDKQGEFYELLNQQIKKLNTMGYQLGNYGEENFNKDNLGN